MTFEMKYILLIKKLIIITLIILSQILFVYAEEIKRSVYIENTDASLRGSKIHFSGTAKNTLPIDVIDIKLIITFFPKKENIPSDSRFLNRIKAKSSTKFSFTIKVRQKSSKFFRYVDSYRLDTEDIDLIFKYFWNSKDRIILRKASITSLNHIQQTDIIKRFKSSHNIHDNTVDIIIEDLLLIPLLVKGQTFNAVQALIDKAPFYSKSKYKNAFSTIKSWSEEGETIIPLLNQAIQNEKTIVQVLEDALRSFENKGLPILILNSHNPSSFEKSLIAFKILKAMDRDTPKKQLRPLLSLASKGKEEYQVVIHTMNTWGTKYNSLLLNKLRAIDETSWKIIIEFLKQQGEISLPSIFASLSENSIRFQSKINLSEALKLLNNLYINERIKETNRLYTEGLAYLKNGDCHSSIQRFDKIINPLSIYELDHGITPIVKAYTCVANYNKAENFLEHYLNYKPQDEIAMGLLGEIYMYQGKKSQDNKNWNNAINYFEKSIEYIEFPYRAQVEIIKTSIKKNSLLILILICFIIYKYIMLLVFIKQKRKSLTESKKILHPNVLFQSIILGIAVNLILLYPSIKIIELNHLLSLTLLCLSSVILIVAIGFGITKLRFMINNIVQPFIVFLLIIGLLILNCSTIYIILYGSIGLFVGCLIGLFWKLEKPRFVLFTFLTLLFLSAILGSHSGSLTLIIAILFLIAILMYIYITIGIFGVPFHIKRMVLNFFEENSFVEPDKIRTVLDYLRKKLVPNNLHITLWESRWCIMHQRPSKEKNKRKFLDNLLQLSLFECPSNSVIDINLWLTGKSIQFHNELMNVFRELDHKILKENPEAAQIAQEVLFDLPDSITSTTLYLYVEQKIRFDLIKNLSCRKNTEFNKKFIENTWPQYLEKRDKAVENLQKSGELNKRLKALPHEKMIPPYSSNGIILDYGKWSDGKPIIDWKNEFKNDLKPEIFFDKGSQEIELIKSFEDWIYQIKRFRDKLCNVIEQRGNQDIILLNAWDNNLDKIFKFGNKGLQETIFFVDKLIEYQMFFEAIHLLESLLDYYNTPFNIDIIEEKIAECEIGNFNQNKWTKSIQLKIDKTSESNNNNSQLRFINSTNFFNRFPGVTLHVLVQNLSAKRFDINPGKTKIINVLPGDFRIIIYPRDITIPPIQANYNIPDSNSIYNLSMELFAPEKGISLS